MELFPERLVDQQAPEAGAIDEQVAVDPAVLGCGDMADPAAFILAHVDDVVDDVLDPAFDGVSAKELGDEVGVEVIRVRELRLLLRERRTSEVAVDRAVEQRAVEVSRGLPVLAQPRRDEAFAVERGTPLAGQPPVGHGEAVGHAEPLERVVEVVAGLAPVLEPDRQLVPGRAVRHPLMLGQAQVVEEVPDRAEGRLTHADDADAGRFHQGDRYPVLEGGGQIGRRHPPGGTATDDDYRLDHSWAPASLATLAAGFGGVTMPRVAIVAHSPTATTNTPAARKMVSTGPKWVPSALASSERSTVDASQVESTIAAAEATCCTGLSKPSTRPSRSRGTSRNTIGPIIEFTPARGTPITNSMTTATQSIVLREYATMPRPQHTSPRENTRNAGTRRPTTAKTTDPSTIPAPAVACRLRVTKNRSSTLIALTAKVTSTTAETITCSARLPSTTRRPARMSWPTLRGSLSRASARVTGSRTPSTATNDTRNDAAFTASDHCTPYATLTTSEAAIGAPRIAAVASVP